MLPEIRRTYSPSPNATKLIFLTANGVGPAVCQRNCLSEFELWASSSLSALTSRLFVGVSLRDVGLEGFPNGNAGSSDVRRCCVDGFPDGVVDGICALAHRSCQTKRTRRSKTVERGLIAKLLRSKDAACLSGFQGPS